MPSTQWWSVWGHNGKQEVTSLGLQGIYFLLLKAEKSTSNSQSARTGEEPGDQHSAPAGPKSRPRCQRMHMSIGRAQELEDSIKPSGVRAGERSTTGASCPTPHSPLRERKLRPTEPASWRQDQNHGHHYLSSPEVIRGFLEPHCLILILPLPLPSCVAWGQMTASLCFSFLIRKTGITLVPITWGCYEN